MTGQQAKCWYALHVRVGKEKHTARVLRTHGYEEFLPLSIERRRWSDRIKSVERSLFPGYVFTHIALTDRLSILTISTVLGIVGINKNPTPVDEGEIANLQRLVGANIAVQPHTFLEVGQRVRLDEGPIRGLTGILVNVNNHDKLVVSVSLLQRSVSVEIDRNWATPIDDNERNIRLAPWFASRVSP